MATNTLKIESPSAWIVATAGLVGVAAGSYLTSQIADRRAAANADSDAHANSADPDAPANTAYSDAPADTTDTDAPADTTGHSRRRSGHTDAPEGSEKAWQRRLSAIANGVEEQRKWLLPLVYIVFSLATVAFSLAGAVFAAACSALGALFVAVGAVFGALHYRRPSEERTLEWALVAVGGIAVAASSAVMVWHMVQDIGPAQELQGKVEKLQGQTQDLQGQIQDLQGQ